MKFSKSPLRISRADICNHIHPFQVYEGICNLYYTIVCISYKLIYKYNSKLYITHI